MPVATEMFGLKELSAAKRRLLEQRIRGLHSPAKNMIGPRPAGSRIPISAEQHRIWLHATMEPDLPIYNEAITIHRYGSFDLTALEASFNEILKRHEAWRTSFLMEDGELLQIVQPELHVGLSLEDLTFLPEAQREAEACRLATSDADVPIGFKEAPLFRARVFRMAADHHWLQLTLHHIIFDGVSIYRTFLPEIAAIYEAFIAGKDSPLPPPVLQYGDYAIWREGNLNTPAMGQHLEYWKKQLAGELPVLRLPTDRPRAAFMSHRGAMESFTLPHKLVTALHELSHANGVSLYMTMLATLKTLFFRYSGQEDVIVGGLADGRRRPELEGLMGYFLDTFAIRTRPSASLPFSEYLAQVKQSVLSALTAAEVPFSKVIQALQPHRDHSHHPVFQTFLSLQPQLEIIADGWDVTKTNVMVRAAKFDLYIEVDERADHMALRVMYSTDLFDAATIQRMVGHWTTVLSAVTDRPECALGDLPLLTPTEKHLMLEQWNERDKHVPASTLHGLVDIQAERTPDAQAIEFEGHTLTYADMVRRANHLAIQLKKSGAGPGTLVAVCLERSEYLPVSLLAILKTGAAYLPLDPGTPRARRVLCLEDASPAVIITQQSLMSDLPPGESAVLLLEDAFCAEWNGSSVSDIEPLNLDDAAYVIHTSGSTGRPKGVEISHRAIVNLLLSMQETPGFSASDTLLAVTTISFDIAGLELFLPLITGGRVVIASRTTALDPYLLAATIQLTGCTVMQATPATWRGLLAMGWKGRPGLRVLCGGEAMTRDLAKGLLALDLEVWNVYGPTETTVWSAAYRVTPGIGAVSVGHPIANTTTYILDPRENPVPIGVAGELYIGGTGVANGYRGLPLLTAEKFTSPAVALGKRIYRTGDHALYRSDGTIEIQGRADNQVKVRGYRIELEDVESALATHPRVAAGAAKVWPDPSGGNRLSAYVVGKHGAPPDAAELREFLKTRMPDYMIPSDVIALDAMPLTSNGKMDRKALTPPVVAMERRVSIVPTTELECKLAAMWSELLGITTIGLEDSFFDLGGHSLLVARLQQRIATEFGRKIAMAAIFHAPTIAGQVTLLNEVGEEIDRSRVLPIQPLGIKPRLFWLQPTPLIGNLSAALGLDQPIFGVTITLEDLQMLGPEPSFESLAGCYARTILKTQLTGPYHLGGLCTSGILAYEVASQLVAAGHTVALLALLDAENPVYYRRVDTVAVELAKLKFYGKRALEKGGQTMFLRHLRSRVRRLAQIKEIAATEMSLIENAILAAAFPYKPPVYDGDVLLMLPRARPALVDYLYGWKTVVRGEIACMDVDGHHDELLDPAYAGGVAQVLKEQLQHVREPAPVLSSLV